MDERRHNPEPARKSYPSLAGIVADEVSDPPTSRWATDASFALDEIDRLRTLVALMDRCLTRAIGGDA
jgi:hypothetical protein